MSALSVSVLSSMVLLLLYYFLEEAVSEVYFTGPLLSSMSFSAIFLKRR